MELRGGLLGSQQGPWRERHVDYGHELDDMVVDAVVLVELRMAARALDEPHRVELLAVGDPVLFDELGVAPLGPLEDGLPRAVEARLRHAAAELLPRHEVAQ